MIRPVLPVVYPEFTQSGRCARGIKFPSSAPRPFGSFLSPYENAGLLRPFPVNYGFFLPKIYPMATYYKTGETWRAQVARRGIRKSASGFKTKAAAVAWAGRVEAEIMAGIRGEVPHLPFSVLLQRYATEVSPKKKGERWEVVRLQALERDPLASVSLRRLGAPPCSGVAGQTLTERFCGFCKTGVEPAIERLRNSSPGMAAFAIQPVQGFG